MKITIDGKHYFPLYIPFYRIKIEPTSGLYNKYGIRWPSGHNQIIFYLKDKNQIEMMKQTLKEALIEYVITPKVFYTQSEKRMYQDVRDLFQLNDEVARSEQTAY